MKLSRILPLVVGGILASSASSAQALDFNFSINNVSGFGNTPGTLTGQVLGLANSGTSAATNIRITSAPAALGLPGSPFLLSTWITPTAIPGLGATNSFTVTGGNLTSASFLVNNGAGKIFLLNSIASGSIPAGSNGILSGTASTGNLGGFGGATYTSVPFDIPGGATIPAVGGLFALGLMRKAKKSLALRTSIADLTSV
jgi:hypothetical protein